MKDLTTQSTGSLSPDTTADTINDASIKKESAHPTEDLMKNRYTEGIMRYLALTQLNEACRSADSTSQTIGSTVSDMPCWITTHSPVEPNLLLATAPKNTAAVNTTFLAYGDTLSTHISPVDRFETTFKRLQRHLDNNPVPLNQSATFKVYWHLLIDWLHHWNLFGMTCKATMTSAGYRFSIEKIELYDPLFDSSLYFTTQDELYKTDHRYVNQLPPADNSNGPEASKKTSPEDSTSIVQLLINAAHKVLRGPFTASEDNLIVDNEFLFPRLQNDNYNCGTWCLMILNTLFKSKISNTEYPYHYPKAEHYRLQQITLLQSTPSGMNLLKQLHQDNVDSEFQSLQYTHKNYISPARLIQLKIFERELKTPTPPALQPILSLWQLVNNDVISLKQFKQRLVSHYQQLQLDQSDQQYAINLIQKYLLRIEESKEMALHADNPGFSYCCEHLLNKQYQMQNAIILNNIREYFKRTEQRLKQNGPEEDIIKTLTRLITETRTTISFIESLEKKTIVSHDQLTELKAQAPTITSLMQIDSLFIPLDHHQIASFCQPEELLKTHTKLLKIITLKLIQELFNDINHDVFYHLFYSCHYLANEFNCNNNYISSVFNQCRLSPLMALYLKPTIPISYKVILNNLLQHHFRLLNKNNKILISFLLNQTELTESAQLILTNDTLSQLQKQENLFDHFLNFIQNSTPVELAKHLYKKRNHVLHRGMTFTAFIYYLSISRDISPILVHYYQQQFNQLQQHKEFTQVANVLTHFNETNNLLSIENFLKIRYQQHCPVAQHLLKPVLLTGQAAPLLLLQMKSDIHKMSLTRLILHYKQHLRNNVLQHLRNNALNIQSTASSSIHHTATDLETTLKDIVFYWAQSNCSNDATSIIIDELIRHNISFLTQWKQRIEALHHHCTNPRPLANFTTVSDFIYQYYLSVIRTDNPPRYSRSHVNFYHFIQSIQTQASLKLHYPANLLSDVLHPSQKGTITLLKQRIVHAFIQSPYELDSMSALLRQVTLFDTEIQDLACSTLSMEFTQLFFNNAHKMLQLSLFHEPNSITTLYFMSRWLKRFFNTIMLGPALNFLHALMTAYKIDQAKTPHDINGAVKRKRDDAGLTDKDQLTWCKTVIKILRLGCTGIKDSPEKTIELFNSVLNTLKPHFNHVLFTQLLTTFTHASSTPSAASLSIVKKIQPLIINLLLHCDFCLDDFIVLQSSPAPDIKQSTAVSTAFNSLLHFSISSSKEFDEALLMIIPPLCQLSSSLDIKTHDETDFEHTNVACALPLLHPVFFKSDTASPNPNEATTHKRSKTEERPSQ